MKSRAQSQVCPQQHSCKQPLLNKAKEAGGEAFHGRQQPRSLSSARPRPVGLAAKKGQTTGVQAPALGCRTEAATQLKQLTGSSPFMYPPGKTEWGSISPTGT